MNHVYRVVFNRILGVWQAVTELAKSQGKIGGAIKRHARKLAALAAIASGASAAAQPAPNQLPQGGQVAAGNITIQQSGAQMQVNQATQKGIVNWQSFDVGSNASVHFNQPNADAATLNRVNSVTASQIHGQLTAVGKVFLLNSNGVVFGPSARVNVGALVAGAMKITDENFLAGNYKFTDGKGVITNMGELTAEEGGLIALLAPQVINEGIIRAKKGTIVLAAGEAITLTNLSSNVTVVVDKPALDALIDNKHLVSAPDGRVFMSAMAAHSLASAVISNTGTIEATGAKRVGDVIRLEGNTVINAGVIDASGNTAPENTTQTVANAKQGSDIAITATKDLTNTGTIKSNGGSGAAGGRGGDGGKITIAAQETITNKGTIEAKGGVGSSVNVTDATTASKGGEITLTANDIVNEGEINASGQIGGQVTLDAQNTVVNQGEINASGQIGGQVTITAAEITQALDAGITVQSVAQGLDESAALPVEILLEMADYVPPQITIEASHNVQLTGKLDVSSLNHDGGTLTIKADSTQLIDIELTAASTVTTGGLIEIESNTTYVDNALIDVSGTVKAGQVLMTAPQPEVPAMPTAPPEPVPVPVPNPSSLIVQYSTITATSRRGQGGNVTLTADTIDLSHTQVLASGDTAGGTIKVGGDWQGQGSLPQAITVTIDEHSILDVSAITNGNAGMIVAWSDIHNPNSRTIVNGTLLAKGGSESGDGGMIETSGYDLKVDGITISTQATNGTTGQWLLDPRNITITSGTNTDVDASYMATADSAIVDVATLQTALNSTNVTVFTGTSGTQAWQHHGRCGNYVRDNLRP
jgi:filamentous hemagglutinin family protein